MNKLLETWHPLERMWLFLAPLIILLSNLFITDSITNIVSSICGILFVILCANGKWQGFIFGIIHCLLYGLVSWESHLIAEAIQKLCFALPLHVCALYSWCEYTCPRTNEVIHQNLKPWNRFLMLVILAFASYHVGYVLDKLGGHQPYLDAITTVGSIYGALLMLRRCGEMWWVFFLVNLASVAMWFMECMERGNHFSILIMWMIWTINSVWGWVRWQKT